MNRCVRLLRVRIDDATFRQREIGSGNPAAHGDAQLGSARDEYVDRSAELVDPDSKRPARGL